jgi:predicted metal-dependent hydrolase
METTRRRDRFGRPLPAGREGVDGGALERSQPPRSATEARRIGIERFDERRFFEAHECFETVWNSLDEADPDRDFWKGVTQVAVGCCHVQRGNARGARSVLARAARSMRNFPSPHDGVDTERLITLTETVVARVAMHGASPDVEFPSFPRV